MENMGGDAKVADYLKANGDDKAEFAEMGFDSLGAFFLVWCLGLIDWIDSGVDVGVSPSIQLHTNTRNEQTSSSSP